MTERRHEGIIVALVNNKGGVGKTASAVALAAGLAGEGKRTLLVDLDAQGSAGLSLGLTRADLTPGTAEVLLDGHPVRSAKRPTAVEGLDILPGGMTLTSADLVLADVAGRETVLKAALDPVRRDYDFIVLDCPPALGLLVVNALVAASCFIVPVTADYLALEGLVNLLDAVDRIRAGIGGDAVMLGIVLTMVDHRLNVTEEIGRMIRGYYGRAVFKTEITVNVKLKEAPSFGRVIFDYAGGSSGAVAYAALVQEVLHRIRQL